MTTASSMTLKKWLRAEDLYQVDIEAVLLEQGVNDPETDFVDYKQSQWDELWRRCVVQRAKDLKDQKAKVRLEKRMKKLEKYWRKQSGSKLTSVTKKKKSKSKNSNTNEAKVEDADLQSKAVALKKYLQKNQCYAQDLVNVCAKQGILNEDDLIKIESNHDFDEIYRQVRVLRTQDLKDQKAKLRMEKLMAKFERLWRAKTGVKLTSVKKSKGQKSKAPAEKRNEELASGQGNALKQWMRKNEIWELQLFDELLARGIVDQTGLQQIDNEAMFDDIVRKVRVEKFKDISNTQARNRVDKLLVSFEKIWRKETGIKKTSIKN